VIGSDTEAERLVLCEATARVMRQCFALLGITPLYRI
jgi:arginyl-tRNA synthetase